MKNEVSKCPMCGLHPILIRTNGLFLYDCVTDCRFQTDIYLMFKEDDSKEWLFSVSKDKFSAIQLWNSQVTYFEHYNKESSQ